MRYAFALVAALAALAIPGQASAFCRQTTCRGSGCTTNERGCPEAGKPLYWSTGCIGYSIQKSLTQNLPQEETRDAIRRAFQAWAELDCGGGKFSSLTFSPLADVSCIRTEYNEKGPNINVVAFKDDDWQYKGVDNTLAKTTLSFDTNTGEIFDADIEINSSANQITIGDKSAQYDLQSILTHEVGHLMGIAHSEFGSATMFASYEPGSTELRTLSADDIAAACSVYPPGRATTCSSTPKGGLGDQCAADAPKGGCDHAAGDPIAPLSIGVVVSTLLLRALRARRRRCDR